MKSLSYLIIIILFYSCFKNQKALIDEGVNFEKSGYLKEALQVFDKACTKGDLSGCKHAGDLEIKQDKKAQAIKYFSKMCDEKDYDGCVHLGLTQADLGATEDAKNSYEKSCNADNDYGCANLGILLKSQEDYQRAEIAFKKGCDKNGAHSCLEYGKMLYNAGLKVESNKMFQKACDGGEKDGCDLINKFKEAKDLVIKLIIISIKNSNIEVADERLSILASVAGEDDLDYKKYKKIVSDEKKQKGLLIHMRRLINQFQKKNMMMR